MKILDFGIAKLGRPGEEGLGTKAETLSNTSPARCWGTMGYMSPEQARGLVADHRSDVFSLGAVLFEMLTGRRAFKGTTPADTLSAILREDPTERLAEGSELSAGLLRVVRRCLEKAPEDRFQSARDLAFALESHPAEIQEVARGGCPGTGACAARMVCGRPGSRTRPPRSRPPGGPPHFRRARGAADVPAPDLPPGPCAVRGLRAGRRDDPLQRGLGRPAQRSVLDAHVVAGIATSGHRRREGAGGLVERRDGTAPPPEAGDMGGR